VALLLISVFSEEKISFLVAVFPLADSILQRITPVVCRSTIVTHVGPDHILDSLDESLDEILSMTMRSTVEESSSSFEQIGGKFGFMNYGVEIGLEDLSLLRVVIHVGTVFSLK